MNACNIKIFLLYFAVLCLVACNGSSEENYVDLGLTSGTMWKNQNEVSLQNPNGLYTFDDAVREFGNDLPTIEQWRELMSECKWKKKKNGYKIIGPNGNSIILPAAGSYFENGGFWSDLGGYWASTPYESEEAYGIHFSSLSDVQEGHIGRHSGLTVRLVMLACDSKEGSYLVKGSPYVYEPNDEPTAIINFQQNGKFEYQCYKGGYQDPDIVATIQGEWNENMTKEGRTIIVLYYDLNTLDPNNKEFYEYFANENELVNYHKKNDEVYGFGPGSIGKYYNFVKDNGDVILYSIPGNLN